MSSSPRDVLKKLVADNPNASEGELIAAFYDLVKKDKSLFESILSDLFEELGPDGVVALLKPKNEKH